MNSLQGASKSNQQLRHLLTLDPQRLAALGVFLLAIVAYPHRQSGWGLPRCRTPLTWPQNIPAIAVI